MASVTIVMSIAGTMSSPPQTAKVGCSMTSRDSAMTADRRQLFASRRLRARDSSGAPAPCAQALRWSRTALRASATSRQVKCP